MCNQRMALTAPSSSSSSSMTQQPYPQSYANGIVAPAFMMVTTPTSHHPLESSAVKTNEHPNISTEEERPRHHLRNPVPTREEGDNGGQLSLQRGTGEPKYSSRHASGMEHRERNGGRQRRVTEELLSIAHDTRYTHQRAVDRRDRRRDESRRSNSRDRDRYPPSYGHRREREKRSRSPYHSHSMDDSHSKRHKRDERSNSRSNSRHSSEHRRRTSHHETQHHHTERPSSSHRRHTNDSPRNGSSETESTRHCRRDERHRSMSISDVSVISSSSGSACLDVSLSEQQLFMSPPFPLLSEDGLLITPPSPSHDGEGERVTNSNTNEQGSSSESPTQHTASFNVSSPSHPKPEPSSLPPVNTPTRTANLNTYRPPPSLLPAESYEHHPGMKGIDVDPLENSEPRKMEEGEEKGNGQPEANSDQIIAVSGDEEDMEDGEITRSSSDSDHEDPSASPKRNFSCSSAHGRKVDETTRSRLVPHLETSSSSSSSKNKCYSHSGELRSLSSSNKENHRHGNHQGTGSSEKHHHLHRDDRRGNHYQEHPRFRDPPNLHHHSGHPPYSHRHPANHPYSHHHSGGRHRDRSPRRHRHHYS